MAKNKAKKGKNKKVMCAAIAAGILVAGGGGYLVYEKVFNDGKWKTEVVGVEEPSDDTADESVEMETDLVSYTPGESFAQTLKFANFSMDIKSIKIKDNKFTMKCDLTNISEDVVIDQNNICAVAVIDNDGHICNPYDEKINDDFFMVPEMTESFTFTEDVSDFNGYDIMIFAADRTVIIEDNTLKEKAAANTIDNGDNESTELNSDNGADE